MAATRESPVPDREIRLLVARSGGNPLFVRELIAAVLNGDSIDALPDSVEDVVVARIDRLSAARPRDCCAVCPSWASPSTGSCWPTSSTTFRMKATRPGAGWTRFVVHDEFGNLAFRNALLRDSAYNGLSFRLRHELHSRAADAVRLRRRAKG